MSTVIILGDVHIGKGTSIGKSGIGTALNSRVIDQGNLLDWTLDQALESNSEHIIITGDIFEDPKPHPSLICLFIDWVTKCGTHGVQVHAIMGNHDALRTGNFYVSPLDILSHSEIENFHLYKDINTIIVDSTAFTLMPFRDRKSFSCDTNAIAVGLLHNSLEYELAYMPLTYTKVLVGHFAIEGSIPVGDEIDDIANELFCPLTMFKGYDFVWMGHVHKPQVMQKKSPYIAHIGSMDISNFGENEQEKYIVLFDTDDLSFQEIKLPTRPLTKVNISIPKDTVDTTQYVLDELAKENIAFDNAIVRLEISLMSSDLGSVDRSKIEKFIYNQGVFNISGFSESKKMAMIKKDAGEAIDTTMDPTTAIKKWADKKYPDTLDENKKKKYVEISMSLLSQLKNEGKE